MGFPARTAGYGRAPVATPWLPQRRLARATLEVFAFLLVAAVTAWSAVLAKQAGDVHALAESVVVHIGEEPPRAAPVLPVPTLLVVAPEPELVASAPTTVALGVEMPAIVAAPARDPATRWFNGRPVRPARTIRMVVTAYSPDARSCGTSADGLTATLHSVETNGSQLVAADPRLLRYGSMVSVAGYASGQIVPVLDCGGAIKGNRLDVLYPTNAEAKRWGRKSMAVTVWEYADGKPAENPRKLR